MNNIVKSGEVMKLKDLISYEEGSIANLDVVSNGTMKFVLMAFDEGTGLTPHRAPGNAIVFALEGKATIGYEEKITLCLLVSPSASTRTVCTVLPLRASLRWHCCSFLSNHI